MLVVDQLKKDDPQLRLVALMVLCGLVLLLAGLWWVQIVSAREYQQNLETQSFRTVRIPAVRGKILDCHGAVLAQNRPTYNISLYLEELRDQFKDEYQRLRPLKVTTNIPSWWMRPFVSVSVTTRYASLSKSQNEALQWQARYNVASGIVARISQRLRLPLTLDRDRFVRHYETRLALPFPVLTNATPAQIALFQEQCNAYPGVDLEIQSSRLYPNQTTAAHVLGWLQRDDDSAEGEESFFSYRMPDYRGVLGIEYGFDRELRGQAGAKSVLVNNLGYRQNENIWSPAEAGQNIVLTLDLGIQKAAERALQTVPPPNSGGPVRGAVVVMEVNTGDILAMASAPSLNPNVFIPRLSTADQERISSLQAEKNRATRENYAPGSVFKTVVGMACLEAGLNPNQIVHVSPNPREPAKGCIEVGRRLIRDTAPPGDYNFRRALELSCNAYFITIGLRYGPQRILDLAQRLHIGERAGLPTRQESSGALPTIERLKTDWTDGNTANLSIGQDPVQVTPLQVAVLMSAIANGGKVFWPRLVDRIEPADENSTDQPLHFPTAQVRDQLGVSTRTLSILHDAMLADTEDAEGTGRAAAVSGMRVCGKTGTAQIQNERNIKTGQTTWFASFAPYEHPKYAVVVMVENGVSGGQTCAPVAGKVYAAIQEQENARTSRPPAMAAVTP